MSVVERELRELPYENLIRAAYPAVEMRDESTAHPVLYGHFCVFDVWTEINSRYEGHFLERFRQGAFNRTFNAKKGFIPPLLEHGQDPSVWKKPLGDVIELMEDPTGAYYEVSLYDAHYVRELLPAIKSGQYGASFRFSAPREDFVRSPGVSVHNPKGLPERTVLEANVAEFSIVLFPAYREPTAGLRSLTDYYNPQAIEQLLSEYTEAQEALREKTEHVERVSVFLADRGLAPQENDTRAAVTEKVLEDGSSELVITPAAQYSAATGTQNWLMQSGTPFLGGWMQTSTAAGMPSVTYVPLVATPAAVDPKSEPDPEDASDLEPAAEAVREEEQPVVREQNIDRLYKRSAQVLSDSIWAVHPGMLEVYINIMAERQAGYRPTQKEIEERIAQRGTISTPDTFDDEMAGDVAIIDICGGIMPHGGAMSNVSQRGCNIEDLQADFNTALRDDNVKAIMFNIDSPGGSVDLVPEFAQAIRDARGEKPIVAFVNTMAASAAYFIASACDEIIVTPSGEVGSIGVYSCHSDVSAMLEKEGIKKTFISAGKYKVDGNPFEPLSDSAKADMQKKVDTYYDMFVGAVAEGRGTSVDDVTKNFGQGRMVLAEEAVSLGMADKVLTLEEALHTLDPEAEMPDEEPEEDEEAPIAPDDDGPVPGDDDPLAHTGSAAREPLDDNPKDKETPSWRI